MNEGVRRVEGDEARIAGYRRLFAEKVGAGVELKFGEPQQYTQERGTKGDPVATAEMFFLEQSFQRIHDIVAAAYPEPRTQDAILRDIAAGGISCYGDPRNGLSCTVSSSLNRLLGAQPQVLSQVIRETVRARALTIDFEREDPVVNYDSQFRVFALAQLDAGQMKSTLAADGRTQIPFDGIVAPNEEEIGKEAIATAEAAMIAQEQRLAPAREAAVKVIIALQESASGRREDAQMEFDEKKEATLKAIATVERAIAETRERQERGIAEAKARAVAAVEALSQDTVLEAFVVERTKSSPRHSSYITDAAAVRRVPQDVQKIIEAVDPSTLISNSERNRAEQFQQAFKGAFSIVDMRPATPEVTQLKAAIEQLQRAISTRDQHRTYKEAWYVQAIQNIRVITNGESDRLQWRTHDKKPDLAKAQGMDEAIRAQGELYKEKIEGVAELKQALDGQSGALRAQERVSEAVDRMVMACRNLGNLVRGEKVELPYHLRELNIARPDDFARVAKNYIDILNEREVKTSRVPGVVTAVEGVERVHRDIAAARQGADRAREQASAERQRARGRVYAERIRATLERDHPFAEALSTLLTIRARQPRADAQQRRAPGTVLHIAGNAIPAADFGSFTADRIFLPAVIDVPTAHAAMERLSAQIDAYSAHLAEGTERPPITMDEMQTVHAAEVKGLIAAHAEASEALGRRLVELRDTKELLGTANESLGAARRELGDLRRTSAETERSLRDQLGTEQRGHEHTRGYREDEKNRADRAEARARAYTKAVQDGLAQFRRDLEAKNGRMDSPEARLTLLRDLETLVARAKQVAEKTQ